MDDDEKGFLRPEVVAEFEAKEEGLVRMVKDGVASFVHKTTVAGHQAVGWSLAAWKHAVD